MRIERRHILIGLAAMIAVAPTAWADLSQPADAASARALESISDADQADWANATRASITLPDTCELADCALAWPVGDLASGLDTTTDRTATTETVGDANVEIQELPALPGSASLFLSAVLSVGAYQLVRSSRQLHFAGMPEWYHLDGPMQIGHAHAVDLSFAPILDCFGAKVFDHPSLPERQLDDIPRLDTQDFLIQSDPRGPPVAAHVNC